MIRRRLDGFCGGIQLALVLVAFGAAGCTTDYSDPWARAGKEQSAMDKRGGVVTASNFELMGEDAERLFELLATPGVERLRIGNVPGGNLGSALRLTNLVARKDVSLIGLCASACATGVLTAAHIRFEPTNNGAPPAALFYHGFFRRTSAGLEKFAPSSETLGRLLKKRFPYLRAEDIDLAVGFDVAKSGLLIVAAPGGNLEFQLCDPAPRNCRLLLRKHGDVV